MSDILYKGCVIPARLPFIEAAARFIIDTLGADIEDMKDEVCCMEPVGLKSLNHDAWLNVSSGIVSSADGKDIVTLCDGCSVSLSGSAEESGQDTKIKGFVEFLYDNLDEIGKKVVSPVDMKSAVFPGCHCESICSRKGLDAYDVMCQILKTVGVSPSVPEQNLCCGGGVSGIDDALSKSILNESIESFRSTGASNVVTSCPFCFMQFDMVARFATYHIAEVVAKAMGWNVDTSQYHRGK